jgi:hypothetical protein
MSRNGPGAASASRDAALNGRCGFSRREVPSLIEDSIVVIVVIVATVASVASVTAVLLAVGR